MQDQIDAAIAAAAADPRTEAQIRLDSGRVVVINVPTDMTDTEWLDLGRVDRLPASAAGGRPARERPTPGCGPRRPGASRMNHRHAYSDDRGCVDVGPNVCLRPTVHGGNPDITNSADGTIAGGETEHLYGFIVAYDWPGSAVRLEGAVAVDPHASVRWEMTGSLEGGDLTLSPSIQAYDSRDPSGRKPTIHGFVRNGTWVPA